MFDSSKMRGINDCSWPVYYATLRHGVYVSSLKNFPNHQKVWIVKGCVSNDYWISHEATFLYILCSIYSYAYTLHNIWFTAYVVMVLMSFLLWESRERHVVQKSIFSILYFLSIIYLSIFYILPTKSVTLCLSKVQILLSNCILYYYNINASSINKLLSIRLYNFPSYSYSQYHHSTRIFILTW